MNNLNGWNGGLTCPVFAKGLTLSAALFIIHIVYGAVH